MILTRVHSTSINFKMWSQHMAIFISPAQTHTSVSQIKPLPPFFHMDGTFFLSKPQAPCVHMGRYRCICISI